MASDADLALGVTWAAAGTGKARRGVSADLGVGARARSGFDRLGVSTDRGAPEIDRGGRTSGVEDTLEVEGEAAATGFLADMATAEMHNAKHAQRTLLAW